ncbi:PREDICTED: metal tolerance protein A2 [Brassica oleracea var. oleracea]|uniref:Uncharacterized protein n=2 Tax=Brassica TaxID=3705 RepID=A0A0D3AJD7_BRAOL|nr:PREDICTED: metal tolerance protein A2 [Brassica oleracea var. oleracea]
MESHFHLHDEHVVPIREEVPSSSSMVTKKTCGEAPCGFSDAKTSAMEAEERAKSARKLLIALLLCAIFIVVEVVGGIKANSLAILTDAAHLLSDVGAFAISLFSLWASGWKATPKQSYGFFRIEILGALVSIQMIWILAGILVYEAIVRLKNGSGQVEGSLMFLVSGIGLLVNIAMAVLLGHDHGHSHGHGHGHDHEHHHNDETEPNLSEALINKPKKQRNVNIQGAYLHALGDSILSVGVMIGGAIIWYKPEWKIIDLICTLVFSVIVLWTTVGLLRDVLDVLMESTPREINETRLEKGVCEIEEVVAIHELHIWAITPAKRLLACHVKIRPEADADMVLDKIVSYIKTEHNITHVTIQIERR